MNRLSLLAMAVRLASGMSPLALLTSSVWAQQAPQLEVIVVTPVAGQGVSRDQFAGNVQTATGLDLTSSNAIDLTAYMNRRLGSVHINDVQNNPFQPDVNFRGFTASPLLGTAQGMSVYLDGVRLNQPFGDVVNWDLIPRTAITSMTLMPGSNPLFGLNTLGGALNVQTKDGFNSEGTTLQALGGDFSRRSAEIEHGGNNSAGLHWYVTGNRFMEDGWRTESPSDVRQFFGKIGRRTDSGDLSLSAAFADNALNGNGLQEQHLLAADRSSVYTKPDITNNKGVLVNLTGKQELGNGWTVAGNAYYRTLAADTYNGDINEDSLDQALYQPNAPERAALTAAGYRDFPVAGESAANTPFPRWRCIAQTLLNDEPGEKCNGLINRTDSHQRDHGLNLQFASDHELANRVNFLVAGLTFDQSNVDFLQGTELGYLNPDHSVTGTGAFADGENAGDIDGEPYDTRVDLAADTRTWSLFLTDTLQLGEATHLTLSGRYNRTRVQNRDAINPGGGTGSLDGDHVFDRLNPAIGLTYQWNAGTTLYASVNQGSRAPSAIELGCADPHSPCKLPNAMAGDPPLKQVVATTTEFGVRGTGYVDWNLGAYRTDSHDDILFVADDMAGFGYFRNFGQTRRQGIEAGFSTEVAGIMLGANYTLIDATYRSPELVNGSSNSSNETAQGGFPGVHCEIEIESGMRLPLIPRQMLKLFADVPLPHGFSLNADFTAIEGSYARGNENNAHEPDGKYYLGSGRTNGYGVLNMGLNWQPVDVFNVFLQVNNVLDRTYNTAAQLNPLGLTANGSFQARPFPAISTGERPLQHSTFFAPGAPRTLWLGARYRL